jgi:beta-glucanase (GH16 family)
MIRFAIFVSFISLLGCNKTVVPDEVKVLKYELVWSDEFNTEGLPDNSKWGYDVGGNGWGNNELQYYTKEDVDNAFVKQGVLNIVAKKEDFGGKNYTSARLITKSKGDWQYGKIEVRAKLPKGLGSWPAIWMLGSTSPLKWPDDGEIDIMEHVGYDPTVVHSSIHTKKYNHTINTQKTNKTYVSDFDLNFHNYTVEWTRDFVKAFVDDKEYFSVDNDGSGYEAWPFTNKMHLLLNVAVGGNWGGLKGLDDTTLPWKMEIDYVKVYQKK